MRVFAVCGPPGSGKTTYAMRRMNRSQIVLDLDALVAAVSGMPWYDTPRGVLEFAIVARDAMVERLRSESYAISGAWIICGGAKREERDKYRRLFNAEVSCLEVPTATCVDRIRNDPRRSERWEFWQELVVKWWREYERHPDDRVLRVGDF